MGSSECAKETVKNAAIFLEVIHFRMCLYTGDAFEISSVDNINGGSTVRKTLGPCEAFLLSSQFRISFDNISSETS